MKRRRFLQNSTAAMSIPFVLPTWVKSMFSKMDSNKLNTASDDLDKIKKLILTKQPSIWLFTGDSITHGAKHTHGYRSYPEVFQERIRYEVSTSKNIVINTGISGNTTQNILDDYAWRIDQFKPTVVSLMIGTNDCARANMNIDKFSVNLIQLIRQMRAGGSIPILHTPNVIIVADHPERKTFPSFIPVIREVAEKENVVLVDNYAYWEEEIKRTSQAAVFKKWLNDGLHPNGFGHQQIARTMFKRLDIFDENAPTCGAPYYEGKH